MDFPRRCADPEQMQALGHELAGRLDAGAVLALSGDLGAGKTELVKGLAAGLGFLGPVTSPTFALLQEYRGGTRPLFHLDCYRLEHPQELVELGWDELLDEGGIVAVEWAERFPGLMPPGTLWLEVRILPEGSRLVSQRCDP